VQSLVLTPAQSTLATLFIILRLKLVVFKKYAIDYKTLNTALPSVCQEKMMESRKVLLHKDNHCLLAVFFLTLSLSC